jgi:hypothetical protein
VRIVAISGRAGSGKSALARDASYLLPRSIVLSLAGPLKHVCAKLYGLSHEQLYGDAKGSKTHVLSHQIPWWPERPTKLGYLTAREVMQQVASLYRYYRADIWIAAMDREIQEWPFIEYLFIDDMRYRNEAAWVKMRGGVTVRCQRPGVGDASHLSEVELDDYAFDHYVPADLSEAASAEWLVEALR